MRGSPLRYRCKRTKNRQNTRKVELFRSRFRRCFVAGFAYRVLNAVEPLFILIIAVAHEVEGQVIESIASFPNSDVQIEENHRWPMLG